MASSGTGTQPLPYTGATRGRPQRSPCSVKLAARCDLPLGNRRRAKAREPQPRDRPRPNGEHEQVHWTAGGLPAPIFLYINMLRALLASLLLTALYARALTGAERRTPLRAKRTKRPPSSSAGAKTRNQVRRRSGLRGRRLLRGRGSAQARAAAGRADAGPGFRECDAARLRRGPALALGWSVVVR